MTNLNHQVYCSPELTAGAIMAVEKSLASLPAGENPDVITDDRGAPSIIIEIEPQDEGVVVQFGEDEFDPSSIGHYDNLAEHLESGDLVRIGSDVVEMFRSDKRSRSDWERSYRKGLKLLGLEIEERTEPFEGACGVFHPLLTESVVRFQAHAVMETFPASGPVKTKIIGKQTTERYKQSQRVRRI